VRAAERKSSQRRAPTQLVLNNPGFVIPAKAGIQRSRDRGSTLWAPAFAGATSAESQAHTCSIEPALQASDNNVGSDAVMCAPGFVARAEATGDEIRKSLAFPQHRFDFGLNPRLDAQGGDGKALHGGKISHARYMGRAVGTVQRGVVARLMCRLTLGACP